ARHRTGLDGEPAAGPRTRRRSGAGTERKRNPVATGASRGRERMSQGNGPERLLLVDDDEEACRLLGEVLEREGYQVVRALSVEQALDALEQQGPFDAVLTDLRMPGASGLDLIRAARAR